MKPKEITDANGVTRDYIDEKEVMSFYSSISGDNDNRRVEFYISGQINNDTLLNFTDEVNIFIDAGADTIIDMSGLTYINSKAQIELLNMQQKIDAMGKGRLQLRSLPVKILEEFERTGYAEQLEII